MSTTNRRQPVMDPESALGFLAQASGVLAGSLHYERTLKEVATMTVPDVADWCAVDIVEPDGSLRQITSTHPDPDQEALLMELRRRYREEKGGSAGATYTILTGEPTLASDLKGTPEIDLAPDEQERYRRLGPRSYMIVPLVARGRTIGALTLLSTREGRHYTETDLEFGQHLGRRFALAIDNARLSTRRRARERCSTRCSARCPSDSRSSTRTSTVCGPTPRSARSPAGTRPSASAARSTCCWAITVATSSRSAGAYSRPASRCSTTTSRGARATTWCRVRRCGPRVRSPASGSSRST